MTTLDLRNLAFEDWVRAIFDHPAPATPDGEEWYWTDLDFELAADPDQQIEHLSEFCRDASFLLDSFSVRQIDQGLWLIFGSAGDDEFYGHLWNADVPWELRSGCIRSIPRLWPALFERADVGAMSYMLWDSLAYDYQSYERQPEYDFEAKRVQDAMFAALEEQLASNVPATQYAALHGLGHLRHAGTVELLGRYMNRPDIDDELRRDARLTSEAVVSGTGVL